MQLKLWVHSIMLVNWISLITGDPTINITKTGSTTLGSMYNITCQVTVGTFRPLVTWYYSNGSEVTNTESQQVYSLQLSSSSISVISINTLSAFHAGEYFCNGSVTLDRGVTVSNTEFITVFLQSKWTIQTTD